MRSRSQQIQYPSDFKLICDSIVRYELGLHVQLFGGQGPDGGIDALFNGKIGDVEGIWIIQYKFVEPRKDPDQARKRILRYFKGDKSHKSEFDKVREFCPAGYLIVTNVEMTPHYVMELKKLCESKLSGTTLFVWEAAMIEHLLSVYPVVLGYTRQHQLEKIQEIVVRPAWNVVHRVLHAWGKQDEWPMWPVELKHSTKKERSEDLFNSVKVKEEWLLEPARDLLEIRECIQSPIYGQARLIAFPSAMEEIEEFVDFLDSLCNMIIDHVQEYMFVLFGNQQPSDLVELEKFAEKQDLTPFEQRQIVSMRGYLTPAFRISSEEFRHKFKERPIAYSLLQAAWGILEPRLRFSDKGDVLYLENNIVYNGSNTDSLKRGLNSEYKRLCERGVPQDIRDAQRELFEAAERLYYKLWHVMELGG